ncbi:MAG: VWA domain-containing protein [Prevotella sp.]|nr:VWA domain-containing protein [Prevotella sp.]
MEFSQPIYFLLLLLLVPYILWYVLWRNRGKRKMEASMTFSDTQAHRYSPVSMRLRFIHLPMILRCAAFSLMVIALARPQTHNAWDNRSVEGIDIMLAIDISTSMLTQDLHPNRIEAAKSVAASFITDRPNDNIGLTIFAGEAFTQCPMTTDHASLLNLLKGVRTDLAETGLISDGTAIGMGLANAVSRLKDSKAKSKVVILLTDGANNMGDISPLTAAQIAKSLGIRIYTIGVGSKRVSAYELDVTTLRNIAATSDGNFYLATNNKELRQIYSDIDKLEKSRILVKKFSKKYEAYQPFALAAIMVLLLEILLRLTVLRRL